MKLFEDKLPTTTIGKKQVIEEIYSTIFDKKQIKDATFYQRSLFALDFYSSNSHHYTLIRNKRDVEAINQILSNLELTPETLAKKAPFFASKILPLLAHYKEFIFKRI